LGLCLKEPAQEQEQRQLKRLLKGTEPRAETSLMTFYAKSVDFSYRMGVYKSKDASGVNLQRTKRQQAERYQMTEVQCRSRSTAFKSILMGDPDARENEYGSRQIETFETCRIRLLKDLASAFHPFRYGYSFCVVRIGRIRSRNLTQIAFGQTGCENRRPTPLARRAPSAESLEGISRTVLALR
jgi:hypothetical protein